MKREINMYEGPLLPSIIRYTVPIILTSLLQLFFNAADLIVVGQFCGSIYVAAVGATGSLTNLIVNLFIGLSIGAGVAVAGAFSLVRFRSAPGSAREIAAIFLAMAIGLATGMGYVALAAIFFVIVAAALLALTAMNFGDRSPRERLLKITIPENLDYDGLFDDIFDQYTSGHTLERVKTTNMGTLYELQYHITLKEEQVPKAFLDALRCRNGNLNILCSREMQKETL